MHILVLLFMLLLYKSLSFRKLLILYRCLDIISLTNINFINYNELKLKLDVATIKNEL
jgi:hypothetical protein